MRYSTSFFVLITIILGCNNQEKRKLQNHIGLIEYDPKIDTSEFIVCHEDLIYPYFHHHDLSIAGEKPALVQEFRNNYKSPGSKESGYITIRFIVNCKGKAGRFRVIGMDDNYEPITFNKEIVSQLHQITSSLEGWDVLSGDSHTFDYVRYLTFKIQNGELKEILP